jgi:hypothetical protein
LCSYRNIGATGVEEASFRERVLGEIAGVEGDFPESASPTGTEDKGGVASKILGHRGWGGYSEIDRHCL